MIKDGIELYLSEDIIQGEEVPFYLLFERDDIKSLNIILSGFTHIVEFHNVRNDFPSNRKLITKDDLKTPNFVGGVLRTKIFDNPFQKAFLKVEITLINGKKFEIKEERILYSTNLKIKALPTSIEIPFKKPPIQIQLKGVTTIFMDINSDKKSELKVELPEDVLDALEKLYTNIEKGLEDLKVEFKEHKSFINMLLKVLHEPPEEQLIDEITKRFDTVKSDKSFGEALGVVIINAIMSQTSIKDRIFLPLLSYFSAAASKKAFLVSPFSCIRVPKGGGKLKLEISGENILEYYEDFELKQKSIKPIVIETKMSSKSDVLVPVKELIEIKRE